MMLLFCLTAGLLIPLCVGQGGLCPAPNGNFPFAASEQCTTFISCTQGQALTVRCPASQTFDFLFRICRPQEQVDCRRQLEMLTVPAFYSSLTASGGLTGLSGLLGGLGTLSNQANLGLQGNIRGLGPLGGLGVFGNVNGQGGLPLLGRLPGLNGAGNLLGTAGLQNAGLLSLLGSGNGRFRRNSGANDLALLAALNTLLTPRSPRGVTSIRGNQSPSVIPLRNLQPPALPQGSTQQKPPQGAENPSSRLVSGGRLTPGNTAIFFLPQPNNGVPTRNRGLQFQLPRGERQQEKQKPLTRGQNEGKSHLARPNQEISNTYDDSKLQKNSPLFNNYLFGNPTSKDQYYT